MISKIKKKYKLTLTNGYYAQQITVLGNYSEEELITIHSNIGRDYVVGDRGSGYNLKFFSNVTTEEEK